MRPGDVFKDGVAYRPVKNLLPGDGINLASHPLVKEHCDPQDVEVMDMEWAVVEGVLEETPDCVVVYNYTLNFAFPADALIEVNADIPE